jgi:hypothetical protein
MSNVKHQQKKHTAAQYGTKEYVRRQFTEWDKAVKTSGQRKLAIAAWEVEKNNELRGIGDMKRFDEITEKFDESFAAILKKYPIKNIHDYNAFDRSAGVEGYRIGKSFDQFFAGKGDKQDALQKLIFEIVKKNSQLKVGELKSLLFGKIGQGVIEDMDEMTISFGNEGEALDESPISGLKDRLSRAKTKIKKNKSR